MRRGRNLKRRKEPEKTESSFQQECHEERGSRPCTESRLE